MKAEEMSRTELTRLVEELLAIVWPEKNADAEWSPDTINDVAAALEEAGLRPGS